jgi:hypothetical protein
MGHFYLQYEVLQFHIDVTMYPFSSGIRHSSESHLLLKSNQSLRNKANPNNSKIYTDTPCFIHLVLPLVKASSFLIKAQLLSFLTLCFLVLLLGTQLGFLRTKCSLINMFDSLRSTLGRMPSCVIDFLLSNLTHTCLGFPSFIWPNHIAL